MIHIKLLKIIQVHIILAFQFFFSKLLTVLKIDKKLNDVTACFLNTINVTGGNSGSPTLNARGKQVGIIFDMTYESEIGDYYVIP